MEIVVINIVHPGKVQVIRQDHGATHCFVKLYYTAPFNGIC